jgi:hypothetical protein
MPYLTAFRCRSRHISTDRRLLASCYILVPRLPVLAVHRSIVHRSIVAILSLVAVTRRARKSKQYIAPKNRCVARSVKESSAGEEAGEGYGRK